VIDWLPGLHPLVAQASQFHWRILNELGLHPRVTSGFRSYTEQSQLWMTRKGNKNPVAAPGTSQHEFGLAYDLVADDPGTAVYVGQALGMVWSESDPVHYAVFDRATWKQILQALSYSVNFGDSPTVYLGPAFDPSAGDD
jgi:D-alanyl-D-alanine carboxypeptidase-like protein